MKIKRSYRGRFYVKVKRF